MILLIIPIVLILSFLFTRLTHPLSMGLTLLIQTIMISLSTGMSTHSFWFSYILFLIFLGGMLVLFIYVASLASNEFFVFSLMTFTFYLFSFFFLTMICLLLDPILTPHLSLLPTSSINTFTSTPFITSWIYSNTSMYFTLFIILYLLLTLIVVVKITNLFKGPLRLSN
uniref:NADH-ubiquinone oxidoreductase chain 6 n=1 Tax=Pseudocarcinus gigas TaxID=205354 RepID=Q5F0F5_PSEGG|nr:NADH dehydrogenase subunit 6 [Pseudocarcinus gigas]AAT52160.1 NADH dehydrogenase subunit 6 [Pseudocarcinus gigas]